MEEQETAAAAFSSTTSALMPPLVMSLARSAVQFFSWDSSGYNKKHDDAQAATDDDSLVKAQQENGSHDAKSSRPEGFRFPELEQYAANFKPPTFTIKELRDAIPPHCFVRNTARSLMYVARDLMLVGILLYLAVHIKQLPMALQLVAWPAYWIAQGVVGFGIWILAHECGHRAFSPYLWVNDLFGLVLHSIVLVPFHAWRISHSTHHKNTNHMDRDQPFVPRTRSDLGSRIDHMLDEAPFYRFLKLCTMFLIGWPWYLTLNAGGPKETDGESHYNPDSKLFEPHQRRQIVISNLGIAAVLGFLAYCAYETSFVTVLFFYGIPYLNVNFWLVLITFLQHTDPYIPHYRAGEWTFVRGSLCTVDRDFGILNHFFHHITDTHVAHHLFSQMPFYHAVEATEHIKKVLGEYYRSDNSHWFYSLKRSDRQCVFVEDEGDVVFYKGRYTDY